MSLKPAQSQNRQNSDGACAPLPVSARPITCGEFRRFAVTLMSGPEGFTSLRIAFPNFHVRIAKTNYFFFAAFTRLHNKLFWAIRGAAGLVALHFGFIDLRHKYRPTVLLFHSAYVRPCGCNFLLQPIAASVRRISSFLF